MSSFNPRRLSSQAQLKRRKKQKLVYTDQDLQDRPFSPFIAGQSKHPVDIRIPTETMISDKSPINGEKILSPKLNGKNGKGKSRKSDISYNHRKSHDKFAFETASMIDRKVKKFLFGPNPG